MLEVGYKRSTSFFVLFLRHKTILLEKIKGLKPILEGRFLDKKYKSNFCRYSCIFLLSKIINAYIYIYYKLKVNISQYLAFLLELLAKLAKS